MIGGVGKYFLVSCHAGVEDDFSDHCVLHARLKMAESCPWKDGAIGK